MTPADAEREMLRRARRQRERAVEKYGEPAALPGGHPEREVFDYAINELAGLPRYCDMMTERLKQASGVPLGIKGAGFRVLDRLTEDAQRYAMQLLMLQQRLREVHDLYGSPEAL